MGWLVRSTNISALKANQYPEAAALKDIRLDVQLETDTVVGSLFEKLGGRSYRKWGRAVIGAEAGRQVLVIYTLVQAGSFDVFRIPLNQIADVKLRTAGTEIIDIVGKSGESASFIFRDDHPDYLIRKIKDAAAGA